MIVFASLENMFLSHSKLMPRKSCNDFKAKYPYIRMGTFVAVRIKDISTKNCYLLYASVSELEKDT